MSANRPGLRPLAAKADACFPPVQAVSSARPCNAFGPYVSGKQLTPQIVLGHKAFCVLNCAPCTRAQELCENRGGRPGLPVPNKLMVSVDVKRHVYLSFPESSSSLRAIAQPASFESRSGTVVRARRKTSHLIANKGVAHSSFCFSVALRPQKP